MGSMSAQTITQFLEARIAEDEADAIDRVVLPTESRRSITTYDAERMHAECAAKRAIIAAHSQTGKRWSGFPRANREETYCMEDQQASPCDTLRALAAVYADHADYRDEWAL